MLKYVIFVLVCAVSLFAQTSLYPGQLDTDARLAVAVNNFQGRLMGAVGGSDTTWVLGSMSGTPVPSMLLSVDCDRSKTTGVLNPKCEIVQVLTVSSNQITVTRGVDGTTGTTHAVSALVEGDVTKWHHNALADAVKKIESTLGANLSNVAITLNQTISTAYDFSPQTPGGTLIAGNNVVNLAPVPLGVNASDTGHYLYISGGAGTAEPCLITGGTASSGAGSGSVIVNCANTHSGAWTIRSATAGIQEAANASPYVFIPVGTHQIYGTIIPPAKTVLYGAGSALYSGGAATTLSWNQTNSKMIQLVNDSITIRDLNIEQVGTATSGSIGIYIAGAGSGVAGAEANHAEIRNVVAKSFWNGMYNAGDGGSVDLYRFFVSYSKGDGIVALGAQGYWTGVVAQGNAGNGITMAPCALSPNCGANPMMSGIQTFNNGGWGMDVIGQILSSGHINYFNNDRAGEVRLNSSGVFADFIIQNAGSTVDFGTNNIGVGLVIGPSSSNLTIANGEITNSQGIGISHSANGVLFNGVIEAFSGVGAQAGNLYGFRTTTATVVNGSQFASPVQFTGASNSLFTGNYLFGGTASLPTMHVTGSSTGFTFSGNKLFNLHGGEAFACDSGSTLIPGSNLTSGTITNNCSRSGNTTDNTLPVLTSQSGIASASTIAPTAQFFHMNGTSAVDTITVPASMSVGSCLAVVPDNVWTLTAAGNIAKASTAVVNQLMQLCWDGVKWTPSY